jgi:hypothetical protein
LSALKRKCCQDDRQQEGQITIGGYHQEHQVFQQLSELGTREKDLPSTQGHSKTSTDRKYTNSMYKLNLITHHSGWIILSRVVNLFKKFIHTQNNLFKKISYSRL